MNKMMLKLSFMVCVSTTLLFGAKSDIHKGTVEEVIQTPAYTYIRVKNSDSEFWAAVMKTDIKKGEEAVLSEQVWLEKFPSKALKKTFDKILFADIEGQKAKDIHGMHGQNKKKPNPKFNKDNVLSKDKAVLVNNIATIYAKKTEYKNKNITFQAVVEQVSNKVMGNTWVKVNDGKDSIIFRSPNEDEPLKKGDKVQVTGTLNTDVNYGYGYKYEVIGVGAEFKKLN